MRKLVIASSLFFVFLLFLLFVRVPGGTDSYWVGWHVREMVLPLNRPPLFYWLGMGLVVLGVPVFWVMRLVPLLGVFFVFSVFGLLVKKLICFFPGVFKGLAWGFWVKHGCPAWFMGLVCVLGMPLFWYRGLLFEEELFGLGFAFLGFVFLLEFFFRDFDWGLLLSGACFLFGMGFWVGVIFLLPVLACFGMELRNWLRWTWVFVFAGLAGSIVFGGFPWPSFVVGEGLPGVFTAVFSWGFGVLGLRLVRRGGWFVGGFVLFLVLPGLWLSRFQLMGVFGLALGVLWLLPGVRCWEWRGFRFSQASFFRMFFLVGVLVGVGVFCLRLVPSGGQLECARQVAVRTSGVVGNDWGFGHWIRFWGGVPEFSPLTNFDDLAGSNASCLFGNCSRVLGLREDLVLNCSGFCLACS